MWPELLFWQNDAAMSSNVRAEPVRGWRQRVRQQVDLPGVFGEQVDVLDGDGAPAQRVLQVPDVGGQRGKLYGFGKAEGEPPA